MTAPQEPRPRRRPTQADVARLAGVSQALVSYIVNDNPLVAVPTETRRRILAAIDELGYVPDRNARSLRTRRTQTLAAIIPDITNPFYPAFQRGIQDLADRHQYDLISYNTDGVREKEEKCVRSVQQGQVDGLVAVFFHLPAPRLLSLLEEGIAIVRLEATRQEAGDWPLDNLYVDNEAAARAAVGHLIDRGHRRIGLIAGRSGPRQPRLRGYRRALDDGAIPIDDALQRDGDFREEGGQRAMRELLDLSVPPSAVFAANDLMAIGAISAVREAGLRVPDDVAVIGFDDIPAAKLVSPSLTTIAQHPQRLGRRAAELIFERLAGLAPSHGRCEEMAFELIVRDSA